MNDRKRSREVLIFPVLEVIETEVFATMPERYRKHGGHGGWSAINNARRETDCFLEGPSFARDGALYVTDIPYGRIFRIDPDGRFDLVAEYDGEPNGLKIHRDGRIFITDYKNGIMMLDPDQGEVTEVVGRRHTETFKGVNDLVFASNGDLYFTDQGQTGLQDPSGRVYRYTAAGRLEMILNGIPSPNGIVLNADETMLFVAVTRGNCVWRAPLMPDGTVSKVGIFVQLSGGVGPDGLACDIENGLAIAHAGLGGVWLMDGRGLPKAFVRSCRSDFTTNIAYGGPGNEYLYVTDSGSGCILRAKMPVPGRPMFSHQAQGQKS